MSLGLGWINANEYSFNAFLLMERFQIALMFEHGGWRNKKDEWKRNMGIALNANPVVKWYFINRCPESAAIVEDLIKNAPYVSNSEDIRKAEIYTLASVEDFTVHTTPEVMFEKCDYIRGWNKKHLFDLVDLEDRTVLDVGAGSGRLTFAAAEKAKWVYASEPVGTMREFLRDKIAKEEIKNIRVLDGFVTDIPFPDDTFDIVMQGHVLGDDWDNEISEITRVCRSGGWLINCPGDSDQTYHPCTELTTRGWEEIHYIGSYGNDVYIHRKQVFK